MYSYSLLLLAALAAVVSSTETTTALRGSQQEQPQELQEKTARRKLFEEVTCRFFVADIEYEMDNKHTSEGQSDEEYTCEFDPEEAERLGVYSVTIELENVIDIDGVESEGHHNHDHHFENAVSGESIFSISNAIIDVEEYKMFLPSESAVSVRTDRDRERRNLSTKTSGDLKTLVIRIIDKKGNQPTLSIEKLREHTFEDESCLKSQVEACSYNKARIQPYGNGGVYDLVVDHDLTVDSSRHALYNAARKAFGEQFGNPNDKSKFDLVLFCNPPESKDPVNIKWGGWGQVGGPVSSYNDLKCGSVATHLHEVGHNLGLNHSGEGTFVYGDSSGLMGPTPTGDNFHGCFNPAKSWQLGWYEDRQQTVEPLNKNNPIKRFTLNGIADYKKSSNGLVGIKMGDYYIGYNRKAGINIDTQEDGDRVTIVRVDDKKFSWKESQLDPGGSFTIENYNNVRDIEVKFLGVSDDKRDAIVEIIDVDFAPDNQEPCEDHIVEIKTDNYAYDTSWFLSETTGLRRAFGQAPVYNENNKVYKTKVCLPYDNEYKLILKDGWGDGLCCGHGKGYYKITNSKNQIQTSNLVNGVPQNYSGKEIVKIFSVGKNPNPSTPPPTPQPTPPPTPQPTPPPTPQPTPPPTPQPTPQAITNPPPSGPCEKYTVEVRTDGYPQDSSWYINDPSGNKKFAIDSFPKKETVYRETVCLSYNSKYEFVMVDAFKDGLCCKAGNGYYKVMDSKGTVVVDSQGKAEQFETQTETINVGPPPKKKKCKNKRGKFKLKLKKKKSKPCRFWARKKKCNDIVQSQNVPVWQLCPKACNACDRI